MSKRQGEEHMDWNQIREKRGEELAQEVVGFVNDMAHRNELFVDPLLNQHRTNQQDALEMMFQLIDEAGKRYEQDPQRFVDLRNEQSYKTCSEIRKWMRTSSELGDRWYVCPCI